MQVMCQNFMLEISYLTSRIYKNKYEAIQSLCKEFNIKNEIISPHWFKDIKKFYENPEQIPSDMKMIPYEYTNMNDPDVEEEYLEYLKTISEHRHYVGKNLYLYDQDICMIARDNNIDIIVLTDMVGSHQIVTEILDTRQRNDSLSSLIYPNF